MFMRYRGGGVSHMVTWHWDDFLQSDGGFVRKGRKGRAVDEEEDEELDMDEEDGEDDGEDEDDEEGGEDKDNGEDGKEGGEGEDNGEGEGNNDDDDDNVIYEREGYGAL